jgi:hypothetical protein
MELAFSLSLVIIGSLTLGYALGYAQLAMKGML